MFKKYFTGYQSPSDMHKNYARQKVKKKNGDQVSLIKKVLNRIEKAIKHVSGNKKSKIKEKEKNI